MSSETTYNHIIHIRPLDYYFFGGEQTFGEGKSQNYFAKTLPYPQQTSILGLLRHLGHIHGMDIGNSFDPTCTETNPKASSPFGYIQKISPLFLSLKEGDSYTHYLPAFLGRETDKEPKLFSLKEDKGESYSLKTEAKAENWKSVYAFEEYHAKKGATLFLRGRKDIKELKAAIETFVKTGINKPPDGSVPEDGFFKQEVGKLKRNWSFSVLTRLEESKDLSPKTIMPFGADKCLFELQIQKLNPDKKLEDYFPKTLWEHKFPDELACMVLTSDAMIDEVELFNNMDFGLIKTVSFRSIHTPVNAFANSKLSAKLIQTETEGQIRSEAATLLKSLKYNLLQRGSMIYAKKEKLQELTKAFDRCSYYQRIGYNHYYIIPAQQNS